MRKLGVVGITLLGLWTVVSAVNTLFASLSFGSSSIDGFGIEYQLGFYVAPAVVLLAIGSTLIVARERLAARWFSDGYVDRQIDAVSLLRAGIILVGIVFSVMAVETVLFSVLRPVIVAASDRSAFGDGFAEPVSVVSILPAVLARGVQLFIGVLLIWFSRPLAGWLWTHERPASIADVGTQLQTCPTCGVPYDAADYEPGAEARCVGCGHPLDVGGA